MTTKRKVLFFSGVMLLMYASHGLVFPQIVPYLTHRGLTGSERGYILAFLAVVAIVGQMIVGYVVDKNKTAKRYFIILTLCLMVMIGLAFGISTESYLYYFLTVGAMAGLIRILSNLFETWVLEVKGLFNHFAFIRSFGSLGWALASLISGLIIFSFGYRALAYVAMTLCAVVMILALKLEDVKKENDTLIRNHLTIRDIRELLANKRYIYVVIMFMTIYIVLNVDNITITDYMVSMGATTKDVGMKWFVAAMSEIPVMMLAGSALRRWGSKRVLMFAIIVLSLRMFTYSFATSIVGIIILATLQSLTFPLILISQKEMIFRESPSHLRATAQMFAIAMTVGASAIITPILSGYLIDHIAIATVIRMFGWISFIPLIMLLPFKTHHIN